MTKMSSVAKRKLQLLPAVLLALAFVTICGPDANAQSVVAIVNGEPITQLDIEQRSKLVTLTTRKTPPRQEILQELIDDKVKIKEGKKFSVDLSPSDVDSAFSSMASRMRMNSEQLSKVLEAQGVRPETLKARLKAETTWTSLVRGRYQSSLLVGEKDVQSAITVTGGEQKAADSFEYQMRQIVLLVPRGAAPSAVELRKKEAETLRARIQSCEAAADFFRSMRDAAIREPIVKTSADLPAPLRDLLDKTTVGSLTPPEITKQGVEMVALCSRKASTADTPAKREARDKLYVQKYEAKSKQYLQEVRKGAMIEYR